MLTMLTGGARSGKSAAAVELAARAGVDVVYVATAQAGDEEMADRIARHRADRPAEWTTVEAPREPASALTEIDDDATVILDCLGLWVTNLLELSDAEIIAESRALAGRAVARAGVTIVVTNEVGSGIVPDNPLARRFRDLLGTVNQQFAAVADRALLCAAGGVLPLVPVGDLVDLDPNV